jgi:hypothetical protein
LGLRFYNEISAQFRRIIDHPLRYEQANLTADQVKQLAKLVEALK